MEPKATKTVTRRLYREVAVPSRAMLDGTSLLRRREPVCGIPGIYTSYMKEVLVLREGLTRTQDILFQSHRHAFPFREQLLACQQMPSHMRPPKPVRRGRGGVAVNFESCTCHGQPRTFSEHVIPRLHDVYMTDYRRSSATAPLLLSTSYIRRSTQGQKRHETCYRSNVRPESAEPIARCTQVHPLPLSLPHASQILVKSGSGRGEGSYS